MSKDNTGQLFIARLRGQRDQSAVHDHRRYMKDPDALTCPQCDSVVFGVIADKVGPFMQIVCAMCYAHMPVMEMHKPQMTFSVASQMGLNPKLPKPENPIEDDIIVGRD